MRCDQHIGLPQRALDFLGRYEAQGPVCPTCHRSMQAVLKVIGHYEGMFMQAYDLYRHPLNDGYADEFLQASPWSSGPMFFIGLRTYDEQGNLKEEIKWDEDEIEGML